jgi:hypothetical protein
MPINEQFLEIDSVLYNNVADYYYSKPNVRIEVVDLFKTEVKYKKFDIKDYSETKFESIINDIFNLNQEATVKLNYNTMPPKFGLLHLADEVRAYEWIDTYGTIPPDKEIFYESINNIFPNKERFGERKY